MLILCRRCVRLHLIGQRSFPKFTDCDGDECKSERGRPVKQRVSYTFSILSLHRSQVIKLVLVMSCSLLALTAFASAFLIFAQPTNKHPKSVLTHKSIGLSAHNAVSAALQEEPIGRQRKSQSQPTYELRIEGSRDRL